MSIRKLFEIPKNGTKFPPKPSEIETVLNLLGNMWEIIFVQS